MTFNYIYLDLLIIFEEHGPLTCWIMKTDPNWLRKEETK